MHSVFSALCIHPFQFMEPHKHLRYETLRKYLKCLKYMNLRAHQNNHHTEQNNHHLVLGLICLACTYHVAVLT
jgi:hypothetical protein